MVLIGACPCLSCFADRISTCRALLWTGGVYRKYSPAGVEYFDLCTGTNTRCAIFLLLDVGAFFLLYFKTLGFNAEVTKRTQMFDIRMPKFAELARVLLKFDSEVVKRYPGI